MKKITFILTLIAISSITVCSCKKNHPSQKVAGTYFGNFQGNFQGADTIVNTGYLVNVEPHGKNKIKVSGTLFSAFEVLVTSNGINVNWVSPTTGLSEFLYQGDLKKLTFKYENGGNTANYIGYKN